MTVITSSSEKALYAFCERQISTDMFMKKIRSAGDDMEDVMSFMNSNLYLSVGSQRAYKGVEAEAFGWLCQFGTTKELNAFVKPRVPFLPYAQNFDSEDFSIELLAKNPHIDENVIKYVFNTLKNFENYFLAFFKNIPEETFSSYLHIFKELLQDTKSKTFQKEMILRMRDALEAEGIPKGLPDEWLLKLVLFNKGDTQT